MLQETLKLNPSDSDIAGRCGPNDWEPVDRDYIFSLRSIRSLTLDHMFGLSEQLLSVCHDQGRMLCQVPEVIEQVSTWFSDVSFIRSKTLHRTIAFVRSHEASWTRLNTGDLYPGFKLLQKHLKPKVHLVGVSISGTINPALLKNITFRPEVIYRLQRIALDSHSLTRSQKSEIRAAKRLTDSINATFIHCFEPLARSLLTSMHIRQNEHADFLLEARMGICDALNRFDPRRGFCFSITARLWITSRVKTLLRTRVRQDGGFAGIHLTSIDDPDSALQNVDLSALGGSGGELARESLLSALSNSRTINDSEKRVFVDIGMFGLTHKDVAEKMKITIRTVRLLYQSAREKLTKKLSGIDDETLCP